MVAVEKGNNSIANEERFTLDAEQEAALSAMLRPESEGACLLGSDMGTGKTPICIEFCKRFGAKAVLIIAPLQTIDGWKRHMDLLGYDDLPFRQIKSGVAGQKAFADYQWRMPGVYFVGQEYFVRLGQRTELVFNKNGKPRMKNNKQVKRKVYTHAWDAVMDVVIFDEVHRSQSVDSGTHMVLMEMGAPKYKIGASGTPTGNSFDGAYAVTKWLWPHRAEPNIYYWRAKWAETVYDPFAAHNQKVVGELVPGAYFASLPCYIRIESDLDIEVDDQKIWVDLLPEQRRVYDELEKQMVAWIQDHPMVVKLPVTKRTRQRQATLALPTLVPILDDSGEIIDYDITFSDDAPSSKVDRMWSILEKPEDFNGEPAIIFTDSQIFGRVLAKQINMHYGKDLAYEWSGKISRKKRDAIKQSFLNGEFKYLVAVIKAAGTGTDQLQEVAANILFVSLDDSRIENEQGIGRAVRRGQKARLVKIRRLMARDTIDSGQLSSQTQQALRMNAILRKRAKVKS